MILEAGTRVWWERGGSERRGTVTDCLLGRLDLPSQRLVRTCIVVADDGGLELLPETMLHDDSPAGAARFG